MQYWEDGRRLADRFGLPPLGKFVSQAEELIRMATYEPAQAQAALGVLANMFRDRGLDAEFAPTSHGEVLTVDLGRRGPLVWWVAHIDTVPPSRANHTTPRRSQGRLSGLGAADMKGALAALMLAAPAIDAIDGVRVRIVVVADEEKTVGEHSFAEYAAGAMREERPVCVIAGEPTNGLVARASRGFFAVRLDVAGIPAHSSRPEQGASAITWLRRVMDAVDRMPCVHRSSVDDPDRPAVAVEFTHIDGGTPWASNMVPARAEARAGVRHFADASPDDVVAEIRQAIDATLYAAPDGVACEITVQPVVGAVSVSLDDPYLDLCGEIVAAGLAPGESRYMAQPGGTDVGALPPGVPAWECGIGADHHSSREGVEEQALRVYAGQIVAFAYGVAEMSGPALG